VRGACGNLHLRADGLEREYNGLVSQALHLAGLRRPLTGEAVDGNKFVSEEKRCFRPDENVTNPAPVATLPLRRETVDLATCHTDRVRERTGLTLDPPLAVQSVVAFSKSGEPEVRRTGFDEGR
jgi:hypothetical protein